MTAVSDSAVSVRAANLRDRMEAAREQAEANLEALVAMRSQLELTRRNSVDGRSRREVLHDSAYARLEARLSTLPIIEQAKGILMARTGCGPDEAFDLLRLLSQRANVKVRDLAAELVNGVGDDRATMPGRQRLAR
jgi:hypothetical protein